jgi:hypothetical protein
MLYKGPITPQSYINNTTYNTNRYINLTYKSERSNMESGEKGEIGVKARDAVKTRKAR